MRQGEYRISQNDMMGDGNPWGRKWSARELFPLADCLAEPGYFQNVHQNLEPLDIVFLCRVTALDRGRVLEWADVVITAKETNKIEFRVKGEIEDLTEIAIIGEEPKANAEGLQAEYDMSSKKWNVRAADGEVLAGGFDKETAQAVANGDIPLPEAA